MKNSEFITVATLENGHCIELNLQVGDVWNTQWGPREVVKIERIAAPKPEAPDCPHGC